MKEKDEWVDHSEHAEGGINPHVYRCPFHPAQNVHKPDLKKPEVIREQSPEPVRQIILETGVGYYDTTDRNV